LPLPELPTSRTFCPAGTVSENRRNRTCVPYSSVSLSITIALPAGFVAALSIYSSIFIDYYGIAGLLCGLDGFLQFVRIRNLEQASALGAILTSIQMMDGQFDRF